jgi:hypothetical protein
VSREIGIAASEITVVCQLSKKANKTIAMTISASTSTFFTLAIDVSMKLAWRN